MITKDILKQVLVSNQKDVERYLSTEFYPYSFQEYLAVEGVPYYIMSLQGTESRAAVTRTWNEYLSWGGLPESVNLSVKRNYLSSTFQKIYLGDICSRNRISNPLLLQLMLKKLAEKDNRTIVSMDSSRDRELARNDPRLFFRFIGLQF